MEYEIKRHMYLKEVQEGGVGIPKGAFSFEDLAIQNYAVQYNSPSQVGLYLTRLITIKQQ